MIVLIRPYQTYYETYENFAKILSKNIMKHDDFWRFSMLAYVGAF